MDWLFRSRTAEADGADLPRPASSGNAGRALRVLLAASFVLPVLIFSGVSWIAYQQHFKDAHTRLEATLGIIYEHATKVFDTFELAAHYSDEVFEDLSDEQIVANEAGYHARLKVLTDALPQLRDIWVVDRDGHPLVSGTIFPMNHAIDVSDREFFIFHRDHVSDQVTISDVIQSKAADRRVISLVRRRQTPAGVTEFRGIITTAIAPEYFQEYYSTLPLRPNSIAALMREDGVVLARYPPLEARPARLLPRGRLLARIAAAPLGGTFTAVSPLDGRERILAYRRLPRHGVYVVTGEDTRTIVRQWMRAMMSHLLFGVPATATMMLLAWIALRYTRREELAYERLHREVAQRELTEHALRQSQKMEAIGRLTGGIAHDFNNLLTAILGNVDLAALRLGDAADNVKRNLASAREASQRAVTLVNRLLAYSRQHPQEIKTVDVNRLVQGMSDLLRRSIGETIEVVTVLAAGVWKTQVDPNQLESAILNLAVNAKDAMREGGRLTIETGNVDLDEAYVAAHGDGIASGSYVMLAVSDSGTGMSREVIDRAFEPFFTTKPAGVGTGLGLSMVYGFVKQSGGHIRIFSKVDEGTSIRLYFPRASERTDAALGTGEELAVAPPTAGRSSETILVVEDDQEVVRFASDVLREAGYRVVAVRDGPSALRVIERDPEIALLFTDLVLPGMSGRELAREARRRRPALPVLFATGYARDAVFHASRDEPDGQLLLKPFTYEILTRKVRQVLDSQPDRARFPQPTAT